MISISTLLTVINSIILITFAVLYVKKHYVILSSEDFETIAEAVENYNKLLEEGQELAGGVGEQIVDTSFFRDQYPDEEEQETEE